MNLLDPGPLRSDPARPPTFEKNTSVMPSTTDAWALWEERFLGFLEEQFSDADAAHDRAHVERVVSAARQLAEDEGAQMDVVVPAAWLHDCVALPKDSPNRADAAGRAAQKASDFLTEESYPTRWIPEIEHAIEAHSYSGPTTPETLEARVVQDADRLDALGATGLARCFMVGGALGQTLYDPADPFCEDRAPDDSRFTVDHFYEKLLRLPDTMQTGAGQAEAERRASFLETYLNRLKEEIGGVHSAA